MSSTASAVRPGDIPKVEIFVAALGYFVLIYLLLIFQMSGSKQQFGGTTASPEQIQQILSWQMGGTLAGALLLSFIGDRRGRRPLLFLSVAIYTVGCTINGFAETFAWCCTGRFLTGAGLAGELSASMSLVFERMPGHRRGLWASLITGLGFLGSALGFLAIDDAFGNADMSTAYFLGAGMGLFLLIFRVAVSESPLISEKKSLQKAPLQEVSRVLWKNGKVFLAVAGIGLQTWYINGVLAGNMDTIAEKGYDCLDFFKKDGGDKDLVTMLYYFGHIAGGLVAGLLADRWGSRKKVLLCFQVYTWAMLIFYFQPYFLGKNGEIWLLKGFLLGTCNGFWPIFVLVSIESFGSTIRCTASALVLNASRAVLIPYLLFSGTPENPAYLASLQVLGGVIMTIAWFSLRFLPETEGRDLDFSG